MTYYSISDADRPWIVLFSSTGLDAIAEALAAQQQIDVATIYATLDGKSRPLNEAERITLFESVLQLRPNDVTIAAELAAARRDSSH